MTPPRLNSRHQLCTGMTDENGCLFIADREPFRYVDLPDNIVHVARDGDTWASIAGYYYRGIDRSSGLWWAVADFQPVPVVDPTLKISAGTAIVVPSVNTIFNLILSEDARKKYASS